jgi:hypothetical protein
MPLVLWEMTLLISLLSQKVHTSTNSINIKYGKCTIYTTVTQYDYINLSEALKALL